MKLLILVLVRMSDTFRKVVGRHCKGVRILLRAEWIVEARVRRRAVEPHRACAEPELKHEYEHECIRTPILM